jgi:prepilin-type N-terminal cleavage/methylation domain-containing protein
MLRRTGEASLRYGNSSQTAYVLISAKGLTLVELMVTLAVILVVIASASTAYLKLLGGFKVQGKLSDTQLDALYGFELLRYDVQMAGYGLPYPTKPPDDMCNVYNEASSAPASNFNDKDPTPTNPKCIPRAFRFSDNLGPNGSDILVIKSTVAKLSSSTRKWSMMYGKAPNCRVKSWGNSDLDFVAGEKVVALLGDRDRRLLPLSLTTANWKLTFADNNCAGLPSPSDDNTVHVLYGVDNSTSGAPLMPFNRVDYYLAAPGTPSDMPGKCFPGSFVFYRATINQSGATAGARNPEPLIDCALDFQVAFGRDRDADGGVETWDSNSTLTAAQINTQLRELRIFVLYHEGGKDDNFRYSSTLNLGDAQTGTLSSFTPAGDATRYRWKVAKLVIKPMNLDVTPP